MDAQPANEQHPRFTLMSGNQLQATDAGAASFDVLVQSAQHEQQANPGELEVAVAGRLMAEACVALGDDAEPAGLCSTPLVRRSSARHVCPFCADSIEHRICTMLVHELALNSKGVVAGLQGSFHQQPTESGGEARPGETPRSSKDDRCNPTDCRHYASFV